VVVPESFPCNFITDRSVTNQINADSKHTSKEIIIIGRAQHKY